MFFSDHRRFTKILILALLIGGLGLYSYFIGPTTQVSYQDCLKNPSICRNQAIAILYAPIISQDKENLVIKECHGPVLVRGVEEEIKAQNISVKGRFQNKAIMADQIRIHPRRYIKYMVSLLSVILVGLVFFKEFTLDSQKMIFRKKPST